MSDAKTLLTTMMMLGSLLTDGFSDGIKDFWDDLDQEWKEAESSDSVASMIEGLATSTVRQNAKCRKM